MMKQKADVADNDKIELQISPRGVEVEGDEKPQPKEYQSWQILPGKVKIPPNVNLKLF